MINLLESSQSLLNAANYSTQFVEFQRNSALAFENLTVMGFIFAYEDSTMLIDQWEGDMNRAISSYQFSLRRSGQKAWNLYAVFLARNLSQTNDLPPITQIEENLSSYRKIARANINDSIDVRNALLSLLPIQAAPQLEAVDLPLEIRHRATELSQRSIDAFLSTSDEAVILQVFEEES